MTWCNVDGITFDRSKVKYFTLDRNHLMAVFGVYPDAGMAAPYQVRVTTIDKELNMEAFNEKMDEIISDIVTGQYDLPSQTNFVELSTQGGYETEYLNLDHVKSVNFSMGGAVIRFIDGSKFNVENVHDDSPHLLKEDYRKVLRAVGARVISDNDLSKVTTPENVEKVELLLEILDGIIAPEEENFEEFQKGMEALQEILKALYN